MSILKTTTKARLGVRGAQAAARNPGAAMTLGKAAVGMKAASAAVRNPGAVLTAGRASAQAFRPAAKIGWAVGAPMARRRAGRRAGRISDAVRSTAEELITYGPSAAEELGLVKPRSRSRHTAPALAAGVAIGAGAVYFLEPEHGREHREKVAALVS
jgi:hypothetical protein